MWLGWTGVGLNAFVLVLLVALPGSLGLSRWWPESAPENATRTDGGPTDDWVDAGEAAWELDGVRVALTFATIAPAPSAGTARGKPKRSLWIGVAVTNVSTRAFEFFGWDGPATERPTLTTADGNPLEGKRAGGPAARRTIPPGKSAECLVVFDAPLAPEKRDLLLELPAEAFRGAVPVRFRIPHAQITQQ